MSFKEEVQLFRDHPKVSIIKAMDWTIEFVKDTIDHAIIAGVNTVRSLYRNIEAVTILTFGALGISHFIGVIAVEHPGLAMLVVSDMIAPLIAVFVIWALVKISMARKQYRLNHVSFR